MIDHAKVLDAFDVIRQWVDQMPALSHTNRWEYLDTPLKLLRAEVLFESYKELPDEAKQAAREHVYRAFSTKAEQKKKLRRKSDADILWTMALFNMRWIDGIWRQPPVPPITWHGLDGVVTNE